MGGLFWEGLYYSIYFIFFLGGGAYYRNLRVPSLFSWGGGGRATNFGGGSLFFLTQNWGGPLFFKLDLVEGYDFLSLYIFTKSQYNVQETLSERFLSFKQIVRYTNVAATDICR